MKFAYAGPFVSRKIITAARKPRPVIHRSPSGIPTGRKYAATSAESYRVIDQLEGDVRAVLAPFMAAAEARRPRRRKVAR